MEGAQCILLSHNDGAIEIVSRIAGIDYHYLRLKTLQRSDIRLNPDGIPGNVERFF